MKVQTPPTSFGYRERLRRNLGRLGRCRGCMLVSGIVTAAGSLLAVVSGFTGLAFLGVVGGVLLGFFGILLVLHLVALVERAFARSRSNRRKVVYIAFPLGDEDRRAVAELGKQEAELTLSESFRARHSIAADCILTDEEVLYVLRPEDSRRVFGA